MAFKPDAAKIKRWREERHWSQEHLAELAGIAVRTLQRIENGDGASQESLMALAAAYGVDTIALSVDPQQEAQRLADLKAAEAEASMRLGFYAHLASFGLAIAIFGTLALASGDVDLLKVVIWWIAPLTVHGLVVFLTQLNARHDRKFGKDGL
ncbi:MAG: helix-turn-helix transcriptional regulator [Pseudomonadota bacterium]|jgi:transcriptional regulator with XRE-family HTH domain|nr:helix-turn-helix transcriptional regulator [Pseudomonadota bacterium]